MTARRAALALACLVAFHMREALFEGRVYFERDLHLQWYGQVQTFVRAVAEGTPPLWDPWAGFGQPLLANANAQLLYPPTWLNLIVTPGPYYTAYLFGHLLLAGLGAWALSRALSVSAPGSLVAAALWTTSGPLLSLGNVWNHLAGAALLPWILLGCVRVARDAGARSALTLAVLLALAVLAGSPDFLLLAALPGLALALSEPGSARLRSVAHLAEAGLLAALLAGAQLLPSLELVLESSRAHLDAGVRGYWSVHPWVALQSVVPLPWNGLALTAETSRAWFEGREPYLFSLYLGLPALALAGLGLARSGHARRGVLVATAAFGLAFAFGRHTPLYEIAASLVPPLRLIRYPAKAVILPALAVALLAGAGYDVWCRTASRRRALVLAGVGFAFLLLAVTVAQTPAGLSAVVASAALESLAPLVRALTRCCALALLLAGAGLVQAARPRLGTVAAAAVAVVGLVDLSLAHKDLNATAPPDFYRVRPDVLKAIGATETQRLLTFDYSAAPGLSEALLHRDRPYMVPAPAGPRSLWLGALAMRSYPIAPVTGGFFVFSSFGRDHLGIQPEPLVRVNEFATEHIGAPEWQRLLARTGVSRLVALHENALDAAPVGARFHGPFFEDVLLYDVPGALPRCRVVSGTRDDDRAETLASGAFDASREALVPGAEPRPAVAGFESACAIRALGTDRVTLESRASGPGLLVLDDAWAPGWSATVDAQPAPLLRADVAFRAVAVPEGRHDVALVYRPRAVVPGFVASLAGLAILATLWLRAGRTRPAA